MCVCAYVGDVGWTSKGLESFFSLLSFGIRRGGVTVDVVMYILIYHRCTLIWRMKFMCVLKVMRCFGLA